MSFQSQVDAMLATASARRHEEYRFALSRLLPAGQGNNTHGSLLKIANKGVIAGIDGDTIFADIRASLRPGDRVVSDSEIRNAINKALRDGGRPTVSASTPRPRANPELLRQIIAQGKGATAAQIRHASPVPIPDDPWEQQQLVLGSLYGPDEKLFIGERHGAKVQPVRDWLGRHEPGRLLGPHIIPNVLSGAEGDTKDGRRSRRADSCVAAFRFAVIEFDNLPREEQLAFWAAVRLPVAVLVDSGNKSVHGWVMVDAADRESWERDVEQGLFGTRLMPLGVDASCRNESRLSRMPGFIRPDTNRGQHLLYLAPEGKAVSI